MSNASIKQNGSDYYEAFKRGDFSAINKKYIEYELTENSEINDYVKSLLSNIKIDLRKGIQLLKIKMNEFNIDKDQQKKYIDIMKYFKDNFDIKSFDDIILEQKSNFDDQIKKKIDEFKQIVKKISKGNPINIIEKNVYDNINTEIDAIYVDLKTAQPTNDFSKDIEAIKKYIASIKSKIDINDEDVMNTKKNIVNFKDVAHYCGLLINFLATICILIYVIVLLISFFNVINLLIKIIVNIISIFYNSVITNNQTISYEAKNMIKSTKNNYKYDIFNILNEQFTSLAVFNTVIYIIYILLGFVIIYILLIIYVNVYRYTNVLNGDLKDMDPKYQLITVLIIIFAASFIHLLIYKFFFRKMTLNKYKEIDNYEVNVDNMIEKNLKPINKIFDEDFFDLLADSSKKSEVNNILANKVSEIDDPSSNIGKYLFMYDLLWLLSFEKAKESLVCTVKYLPITSFLDLLGLSVKSLSF
jgi:hypothetical protein